MTPLARFRSWAPTLLAAAEEANSVALLAAVRGALTGAQHFDLPLTWKYIPDPLFPSTVWIGAFHHKLKSPNFFMRDWRFRSQIRKQWIAMLWDFVCKVEGVASRAGVQALGRAPHCREAMAIQTVRLVPSVREFLRDSENSAFCTKQATDALKDVGLIREDSTKWLTIAPLLQDVSPIGNPVTLFILRPQPLALLGAKHVHHSVSQSARREGLPPDRGAEEGRTVPRARRVPRTRAVDV